MNRDQQQLSEGILFTDQYQLSMAQLYFRMGIHETPAQFDHYFRRYPNYGAHEAGFCVAAGLEWLVEWMQSVRFGAAELDALRAQRNRAGKPVFGEDFLAWLSANGDFSALSLFAIPEGRVVHPNLPLSVVEGPLAMAQILETALLNQLNYQTLIATRAARMRESARGSTVLEFGLRRGQGFGANAGTRAALIGGADFTSNVGLSHVLGYQPRGTHAHSMVQVFMARGLSELDAFRAYAEVYPDDCLLLVDTIDTLESGVPNAIRVFEELRGAGHTPIGIRLDSGDLAYLAVEAAALLNAAGFAQTSIVLSNDLDELVIWQIQTQIVEEARRRGLDADAIMARLVYGVGTRLVTSHGEPALGGVFKLVALQEAGIWQPAIKIAEPAKITTPGRKQAWRIYDQRGIATADLLTLADEDPRSAAEVRLFHPADQSRARTLNQTQISAIEPLLVEVIQRGRLVHELPPLEVLRERRRADIERLDAGVRRIVNPHIYHVSLSERLWALKRELLARFS